MYSIPDSKKVYIVKMHMFSTAIIIIAGTKNITYTIYFVNNEGNPLY